MTKLILVRHGQTVWNKELKYQGHSDVALSDEGLRQAELVAERLAGEKIGAIYASDLCRAFITAKAIAARHGLKVVSLPALREIKFGEWEGLTYSVIGERWPDEQSKLFTHTKELIIPGGESFSALKERAEAAVAQIVNDHSGDTVVVVSHGGTIRTIICAVLDIDLNHVWHIRQDNTAVNIIEYYDGKAILALLNDCHHLRG